MSKAIWIFIAFGFVCIAGIYLIFGPVFLVESTQDALFYIAESNNTTQVKATVTFIDETSAVDSGSEYNIYVSYEYGNVYPHYCHNHIFSKNYTQKKDNF